MKTVALLLLAAGFAAADFGNDPPVPARKPVFYTGHWKTGIEIEVIYDLMCSDSAALNPAFQEFLKQPFLDSTVADQIQLSYTFLPLPYHHEVWVPHLLVPYLLDQCHTDGQTCHFYDYIDFCFKN